MEPIRVLFVCHGNICRSPMAEFILGQMAEKEGLSDKITAASCGVSYEEYGNPVYPPAARILKDMGIDCSGKRARVAQKSDYEKYDLFVTMDRSNVRNLMRIFGGDPEEKLRPLMSFTGSDRDVADPYYSGDFQQTKRDIVEGCRELLKFLKAVDINNLSY